MHRVGTSSISEATGAEKNQNPHTHIQNKTPQNNTNNNTTHQKKKSHPYKK